MARVVSWDKGHGEEEIMMKRMVLLMFAAATLVIGAVGCHTVHGAGQDIERTGEKIQEHSS